MLCRHHGPDDDSVLKFCEVTWVTRFLVTSYYHTPERAGDSYSDLEYHYMALEVF
jgi:hypothetical protein